MTCIYTYHGQFPELQETSHEVLFRLHLQPPHCTKLTTHAEGYECFTLQETVLSNVKYYMLAVKATGQTLGLHTFDENCIIWVTTRIDAAA